MPLNEAESEEKSWDWWQVFGHYAEILAHSGHLSTYVLVSLSIMEMKNQEDVEK